MAPISEPSPTPQLCPRCGVSLTDPKPSHCANCGTFLRRRSIWVTVAAALGAVVLLAAAFCLGGFAAIGAVFASGEPASVRDADMRQVEWIFAVAVLCLIASIVIVVWLLKKPKPSLKP